MSFLRPPSKRSGTRGWKKRFELHTRLKTGEHMDPQTAQELTAKIRAMIATTIGLAPADLGLRDSLVDKYGMESLDFLDISFRVNKEFGVKLFRGNFLQKASEALGGIAMQQDGKLTEAAVKLLKARMTEARENPHVQVGAPTSILGRLYCVDSWVRQVSELRDANQTSGEAFLDEWLARYHKNAL
jgi:acyl carrier protein